MPAPGRGGGVLLSSRDKFLDTEKMFPKSVSQGKHLCPYSPAQMTLLAGPLFLTVLKAVKGYCQVCFASQFMFLRGW